MLKNLLTSLSYFFIILFTSTLLLTILNYFNILGPNIISVLKLIIPITAMFVASYKLGNVSAKNGYIEGIKIGAIIIGIFLLIILLLDKFTIKSLLYYLILLLTSVLSSMIGINKKKND